VLRVEHGDGLRAVVDGLDVGLAGQAGEDFLVDLQDVLLVSRIRIFCRRAWSESSV
jgi:hypothetical protein